jgi:ParB-like chromosome segregation protein Spo0J
MKVSKLKPNPSNPRVIKDEKFKKLVKSLQEFPEMMEKRPMVCVTDVDGRIYPLGGNMRLRAVQELGMKEIPDAWVMMADDWTEDKRREFTIKDNVGFGEWEWDQLANEWDAELLADWGLEVWQQAQEPDYSILDEDEFEDQIKDMAGGVRKAIQIEFEAEHYEEAQALVKFWRERDAYIGAMIIDYLKAEKDKL